MTANTITRIEAKKAEVGYEISKFKIYLYKQWQTLYSDLVLYIRYAICGYRKK